MKLHLLLVASLGLCILTSPADAGSRGKSFTGRGGQGLTRNITGERLDRGYQREAITTGPKGNTFTGEQTAIRNGDGTASVTGNYSTSTGKGATTSRVITPTENGRASTGTITGNNGQTATTSGSVMHDDGTRTATRSVTGPNGETKSATKTTTVTK